MMINETPKNPYRPGVGTPPTFLAGRDTSINRFRALLRGAPELPANMRMTGLRGVGKTVLLNKFAQVSIDDNWLPALTELQPGHNSETRLKQLVTRLLVDARARVSLTEKIKHSVGTAIKNSGTLSLSWNDITLSYDPTDNSDTDLIKDLFDTTKLATEKGFSGLVILLDEAQVIKDDTSNIGEHPLSMLIANISTLQRNNVPISLILCGLPTLTSNLLRARSYTERMFRGEQISSLDTDQAKMAFLEPLKQTSITADPHLVEEVVTEVEGYPYFIQLWGAELWDAAQIANVSHISSSLLSAIRHDIYERLDLDFYEPRVQTLTPAEQDILLATIECSYPPLIVSDLKDASDKTPKNINVLLGRLNEAGVIYRLRKGQYEYTAPKFRQYLERHISK
jgi:DNA-binding transcriptional ArsR family regulator